MKYTKEFFKKWLNMSPEESRRIMSEAINGKPRYSDSQIAMWLALKYKK